MTPISSVNHAMRLVRLRPSLLLALLAACAPPAGPAPAPAPGPVPVDVTIVAPPPVPAPVPTTPVPPRRTPPGDASRPFERPNGMLLRTGSLVYDLSSTRAGEVVPLGVRTVTVTESSLGGAPSWLIAEMRTGTALATSDSLYVTRADLSPTRWVATIGKAQLGASITRDSLFGAMQSYQGRSSFISALPPGALLTPGMVERIVELLPLELGYRAAASLVLLELGSPRALPAELAVDREEQVALPTGPVDCWVVTLKSGPLEERLWVSKSGSRVVKTEQTIPGGVLTGVLRN